MTNLFGKIEKCKNFTIINELWYQFDRIISDEIDRCKKEWADENFLEMRPDPTYGHIFVKTL